MYRIVRTATLHQLRQTAADAQVRADEHREVSANQEARISKQNEYIERLTSELALEARKRADREHREAQRCEPERAAADALDTDFQARLALAVLRRTISLLAEEGDPAAPLLAPLFGAEVPTRAHA